MTEPIQPLKLNLSTISAYADVTIPTDKVKDDVILFLQDFFALDPTYTFDRDETKTKIFVQDIDKYNPKVVDPKPRIVVSRDEIKWMNYSLDNLAGLKETDTHRYEYFLDHVAGSVTCNCLSKNGVESEVLASKVFMAFRVFKQDIRNAYSIFDIDSVSIGKEQRLISDVQPNLKNVPVLLSVTTTVSWSKTYSK